MILLLMKVIWKIMAYEMSVGRYFCLLVWIHFTLLDIYSHYIYPNTVWSIYIIYQELSL